MMLAALLLAVCVPLTTYTPTPTLVWDAVPPTSRITGYALYYRMPGGSWQLLRQFPTEYFDLDDDGVIDSKVDRGVNVSVPLQRYCPGCTPLELYEFSVASYVDVPDGPYYAVSSKSVVVPVCFPELCVKGGPPCN